MAELASKMNFMVIRSYKYDKPGMYSMDDFEAYSKKLTDGTWNCSIHERSKTGSTDICSRTAADHETNEMVILDRRTQRADLYPLERKDVVERPDQNERRVARGETAARADDADNSRAEGIIVIPRFSPGNSCPPFHRPRRLRLNQVAERKVRRANSVVDARSLVRALESRPLRLFLLRRAGGAELLGDALWPG